MKDFKFITNIKPVDPEEVIEFDDVVEQSGAYKGDIISVEELKNIELEEGEKWVTTIYDWYDWSDTIRKPKWNNVVGLNFDSVEQGWDDLDKDYNTHKKFIKVMKCKSFNGLDYIHDIPNKEEAIKILLEGRKGTGIDTVHFDYQGFEMFINEVEKEVEYIEPSTGIVYYSVQDFYPISCKYR